MQPELKASRTAVMGQLGPVLVSPLQGGTQVVLLDLAGQGRSGGGGGVM